MGDDGTITCNEGGPLACFQITLEVVDHGAAWIVGEGEADIDETSSGLHARRAAEIDRQGGWWSLNGGKLTTAPLASELCVAELTGTEPKVATLESGLPR